MLRKVLHDGVGRGNRPHDVRRERGGVHEHHDNPPAELIESVLSAIPVGLLPPVPDELATVVTLREQVVDRRSKFAR